MRSTPQATSRRRRPRRAVALAAAVAVLAVLAGQAGATPSRHAWTDWFSDAGGVDGRLLLGGSNVQVQYRGPYHSAVLNATFPEWAFTDFANDVIANNPPPSDVINLQGGPGRGSLSFSQTVINPVMSILSLGLSTRDQRYFPAEMVFDPGVRFEVLSSNNSPYGDGGPLTQNGQTLRGMESAGSIRFIGAYNSIGWTTPLQEREFSTAPVGGSWHITVGAPCERIDIGAGPLRSAATVLAGCAAVNTAADWQQDAALTVLGRYSNAGQHTLAGDLILGATASYVNTGQVVIGAGRRLDAGAQTYVDLGRTDVSGTLDLHGANLQVASLVRVLAGGQVLVGGAGDRLLGGDFQLGGPGASMRVLAPTTFYGRVSVGGGSVFELGTGVPMTVTDGGRLTVDASDAILSNNGRLSFLGGRVDVTAGNVLNNGQLLVESGAPVYVTGGLLRNAAAGRIQTQWQIALGGGSTPATLANDGDLRLVGAQGQLSVFNNSSFVQGASGRLLAAPGSMVEVTTGGRVTLNGTTTIEGSLDIGIGGRLVIDGGRVRDTLRPGSNGRNAGDLVNLGVLEIDSVLQAPAWVNDGTLDNGNQFELMAGTTLVNHGLIVNRAFMTIGGFLQMEAGSQLVQHGGSLMINGRLTGGRIASGDPLTIAAGRLLGTGTIDGDVVILGGGTAAPGRSPGTLQVLGDMVVGNGGGLALEMARDGRQDRLIVDGRLRLGAGSTVRLLFPRGAPDVDQTFALLSSGRGPAGLGGAQVLVDHATLGWTAYAQDNGQTLALAFQDDTARRLEPTDAWGQWIVDPGQIHYADDDLGRRVRVDVAGTLGLRASAALVLERAATASGGRLLNSGDLFISSGLDNGGETINRGRLTAINLDNHGAFTNRGALFLGWPGDPTARFVNRGSFQHLGGSLLLDGGEGGALAVDNLAGAELRLAGTQTGRMALHNRGVVVVERGGVLQASTVQQDGGTLRVDGELSADALSVLGGELGGTGLVHGAVRIADEAVGDNGRRPGTRLRPGLSPADGSGALVFDGPVQVASIDQGVVIEIDIASADAFGQLRFLGGLSMDNGTRLQVVLLDGFSPGQGLVLPLLAFDPLQTDFIGLQYLVGATTVWQRQGGSDAPWQGGSWALALEADRLELQLTAAPVPEPASGGLLGAGLAGLGALAWRRRRAAATAGATSVA